MNQNACENIARITVSLEDILTFIKRSEEIDAGYYVESTLEEQIIKLKEIIITEKVNNG